MPNILKHETAEDVKREVLDTLQKNNWKEILCTTPKGTYINPYQNAQTIVASAKMSPVGVFESETFCDNMLRQTIIENLDDIARFVIRGVPMKIFVTEYEENIGFVAQVISDTQITKTTTYKTALYISKHKDSEAGFYISAFTPVL
jgi:hypothetical protein